MMLRRGLPRVVGGEPWPPPTNVETADPASAGAVAEVAPFVAETPDSQGSVPPSATPAQGDHREATPTEPNAELAQRDEPPAAPTSLRRGLPRALGGEPWPSLRTAPVAARAAPAPSSVHAVERDLRDDTPAAKTEPVPTSTQSAVAAAASTATGTALRRGLPRTPEGEAWPPAGTAAPAPDFAPIPPESQTTLHQEETAAQTSPDPDSAPVVADAAPRTPSERPAPAPASEPARIGPFTRRQWVGGTAGVIGLVAVAALALFVRWLLRLEPMQDFLTAYPGEYQLPVGAPVGFPGWLGWQHFFNMFLVVLIIRSGLRVRTEKRPTAFWTGRGKNSSKISLNLWFHQSLDILWLVNGVVFVVLLFVTGQWMRVVPTSWEVFPNALSAALQYVSLDWPTENGWVNYNSLQQLAYFVTIFVAAPLAAITGYRMSGMWPKDAHGLNRTYPVEWARAVHFPVMLYFVLFIFIHVALVLWTGALRNLNHMYAAQGSPDPTAYADNWTGFWMLVVSLAVIAAIWVAARPILLAPIAKIFGKVSGR